MYTTPVYFVVFGSVIEARNVKTATIDPKLGLSLRRLTVLYYEGFQLSMGV